MKKILVLLLILMFLFLIFFVITNEAWFTVPREEFDVKETNPNITNQGYFNAALAANIIQASDEWEDGAITPWEEEFLYLTSHSQLITNTNYELHTGTPTFTVNFTHPDQGCNWTGVAGQVFGAGETPVSGLVVLITGTLESQNIWFLGLTGSSTAVGPGGFDISLTNHLVNSQGTLKIQLKDLSGNPKSTLIPFDTFADCQKNQVIINFVEQGVFTKGYFPVVLRKR